MAHVIASFDCAKTISRKDGVWNCLKFSFGECEFVPFKYNIIILQIKYYASFSLRYLLKWGMCIAHQTSLSMMTMNMTRTIGNLQLCSHQTRQPNISLLLLVVLWVTSSKEEYCTKNIFTQTKDLLVDPCLVKQDGGGSSTSKNYRWVQKNPSDVVDGTLSRCGTSSKLNHVKDDIESYADAFRCFQA